MTSDSLLWEARKRVLFSYFHKIVLFAVACFGFWALNWLSGQKSAFDQEKKSVTPFVVSIVGKAAERPSCVEQDTKKTFATRDQLTLAMQDRAEACVWEDYRFNVKDLRGKMAQIAMGKSLPKEALEAYTWYADYIAKEEAFAASKARAARQYVGAMLASRDLKAEEAASFAKGKRILARLAMIIQPTLDEEKGSYVVYEILWYASLLLGVAAASMLFVVILTALPITNGEGYWTKRIGDILDRVPAVASRSIAVPLCWRRPSAGGTLAGAVHGTQAGGRGAPFGLKRAHQPPLPTSTSTTSIDKGSPSPQRAGDVVSYNDFSTSNEMSSPYDASEVAGRLDRIGQSAEKLVSGAEAARRDVVGAIGQVGTKVGKVEGAVRDAERALGPLQRTVDLTSDRTSHILEEVGGLKPLIGEVGGKVAELSKDFDQRATTGLKVAHSVEGVEKEQAAAFTQTLAASAESDPRGFFARTFGWTLFEVGPAVPLAMAARLGPTKPGEPETVLLAAVTEMREEAAPLNRWAFKGNLLAKLKKPSQGPALTRAQIDSLMEKHFRSLLHLCALPQW